MKKIFILFIVMLSFTVNANSQVEGDVRSKDNKRIPNAVILALDTTNKIIDSVFSADDGFYSFETLKPGTYTIVAKATGFENRMYKKIIAREKLVNEDAGKDISNATRLQIVLTPLKPPK